METKDILKQLRIDAGLTQKQISENSGVSYSAYQKYESGERELGANSLKKLADYYQKTTDYLLGREEKQEPYYHTKLEDSIKEAYLSLPREVRANILQAMVDAVLSYQQGRSTTTVEQSSNELINDAGHPTNETQQVDTEITQQAITQGQPPTERPVITQNHITPRDIVARNGENSNVTIEQLEKAFECGTPIDENYFEEN